MCFVKQNFVLQYTFKNTTNRKLLIKLRIIVCGLMDILINMTKVF